MNSIDTNILVRFLIGDDEKQSLLVYKLFKDTEVKKETLQVPVLVIIELIWVLDSVYKIERMDILNSLDQITLMPLLKFESLNAIQKFIREASATSYDLSDLLIAECARLSGSNTVLTFDKKAAKYHGFTLVKE